MTVYWIMFNKNWGLIPVPVLNVTMPREASEFVSVQLSPRQHAVMYNTLILESLGRSRTYVWVYTLVYTSCFGLTRSLTDFKEFTCYGDRSKLVESRWKSEDPEGDSGRSEYQQCDFVLSGGQCYAFKALVAWLRSTSPPLGKNLLCLKPPSHAVQK